MKVIIIFATLFVAITSVAYSSVTVECKVSEGVTTPALQLHLYNTSSLTSKISALSFALVSESYAEAYAGIEFAPVPSISIGLGAGLETAENPWRIGASLWMGHGPVSLFAAGENGGTGYWYKVVASYAVTEYLTTGIWSKRFAGVGPMIQLAIPRTLATVWMVPAYDFEFDTRNFIVGVKVNI